MRFIIFFMITVLSIFSGQSITAEIKNDCKKDKNYPLRKADREKDVQSNILSNIQFSTTNFGPVFYGSGSSLVWPRGSKNQYIIDAGLWFGCQKKFGDSLKAQVMIANDTRTGNSQMVPGRIKDGDAMIENKPAYYRIYFSSDMDEDGYPFYPDDGPNWPLWNKKTKNAFSPGGVFIPDTLQRNRQAIPGGPVFVSDEDIFCTYKDTYTKYYYDVTDMKEPLRIQVEQTIYTWGEGFQKDHLVVSYKLINMSEDTLHDCSIGFVTDFDIGIYNSLYAGLNDSIRLYKEDMSLNLASCWSGFNLDEDGKDFGYLGLSLLRGPAIGKGHYLRRDKAIYQPEELAGLRSFKIWAVTLEPKTSDERYQYLTDTTFEEKYKGSDKRALISTELFNMIPGDTAKTAFLISFAMPSVREEADSTPENMAGLIEGVKKMRKYYYEDVIYTGAGVEESRTADHDDFKIYPNPSSGAVNIDLFIIKPGIYRAEVYDIYGRMVLAKSFDTAVSSSKNIKIDAAGLANGTYMVRITGPDGSSVSKKLIISG